MTSARQSSIVLGVLALAMASEGSAQCMLANPSFELVASGGEIFRGWNQFGAVGSTSEATHGQFAARVSGPNTGGWAVSAYWQRLDSAPGDRWSTSVQVWHSSTNPLTGDSRAIVNIEWRDDAGNLIDYESHTAADANTPTDVPQSLAVESGAAPPGTVATHFLIGVLQGPDDPAPDTYYDQATFDNMGPPTLEERQWFDFPGGRMIEFSGRSWRVKGPGLYGPGPNLFCDTSACTWVDANGRLHLTIQQIDGSWYSTEVTLEEPLGYGDYIFTTLGRLDQWHPNIVLGLFVWQYGACYDPALNWWNPHNEIDVEFSRWGSPGNDVGQFVAQPHDFPGNISRFPIISVEGERTSHAFRWEPDVVEYRSWRGGPGDEAPEALIHTWAYTGPHIPRPEQPRVHLNLWQFEGPPDSSQEVVIDEFNFIPASQVGLPTKGSPKEHSARLLAARPNPFRFQTTIRYSLAAAQDTKIRIFDVSGRLVRILVNGTVPSGDHEVVWDGRDEAGSVVASGVYLYHLRAADVVESRRVVRLD